MLGAVLETNRKQVELAFNLIRKTAKNRVGVPWDWGLRPEPTIFVKVHRCVD